MGEKTKKRFDFFTIRQKDREERNYDFKRYKRNKNRVKFKGKLGREQLQYQSFLKRSQKVVAPENFILKEDPLKVLEFIRKIRHPYNKEVFVDLKKVQKIKIGAITLLMSVISEMTEKGYVFRGNKPKNETSRTIFEQSGFFRFVNGGISPENLNNKNVMFTKGMAETQPEKIASIIEDAMNTVFNEKKPNPDLYRILMEMMSNSIQHAYVSKPKTRWWVAVNHDEINKKVTFVFLDNGLGIIQTLKPDFKEQLINMVFNLNSQSELLYRVFNDKIGSSTEIVGRGRGLPAIFKKQELFSNFVVLSNNAMINFDKDLKSDLSLSYNGTFYYWELIKDGYGANSN